jgi:hypothetical protein
MLGGGGFGLTGSFRVSRSMLRDHSPHLAVRTGIGGPIWYSRDRMGKPTPVLLAKGWKERQDADGTWFVNVERPRAKFAGCVFLGLALCYAGFLIALIALFRADVADVPWWAYAVVVIIAYLGLAMLGGGMKVRIDAVRVSRSGGRFAIGGRIEEDTTDVTEFRAVALREGSEIWAVVMVTRDHRTVGISALNLRPEAEEAAARLTTMLNDVKQTRKVRRRKAKAGTRRESGPTTTLPS